MEHLSSMYGASVEALGSTSSTEKEKKELSKSQTSGTEWQSRLCTVMLALYYKSSIFSSKTFCCYCLFLIANELSSLSVFR